MRENGLTMEHSDGVLNIKLAENTSSKISIMESASMMMTKNVWIRKSENPCCFILIPMVVRVK